MRSVSPFERYPEAGGKLLPNRQGLQSRRVDCAEYIRLTGITYCVYCRLDFTIFENWLNMVLDHVIPQSDCARMECSGGISPQNLTWSYSNAVLACSACNGFCNRFKGEDLGRALESTDDFFALRERYYVQRYEAVRIRRLVEKLWFDSTSFSAPHREVLLEVGCEGGSIKIIRERNTAGQWEFWVASDEALLLEDLVDGTPAAGKPPLEAPRRFNNFAAAAKELDRRYCKWREFSPLGLHPEFAGKIQTLVSRVTGSDPAKEWMRRFPPPRMTTAGQA